MSSSDSNLSTIEEKAAKFYYEQLFANFRQPADLDQYQSFVKQLDKEFQKFLAQATVCRYGYYYNYDVVFRPSSLNEAEGANGYFVRLYDKDEQMLFTSLFSKEKSILGRMAIQFVLSNYPELKSYISTIYLHEPQIPTSLTSNLQNPKYKEKMVNSYRWIMDGFVENYVRIVCEKNASINLISVGSGYSFDDDYEYIYLFDNHHQHVGNEIRVRPLHAFNHNEGSEELKLVLKTFVSELKKVLPDVIFEDFPE